MQFTIFGYPKSGKTTFFNLLTGAGIDTKTYASGKGEPHQRKVDVPDKRLDKLNLLFPDKEKKHAFIDFVDLAGTALGKMKNSNYLHLLRMADGLIHVIRNFQNEQILHSNETIDPEKDGASIEEELILTDLYTIETRLEKLKKEHMRNKTKEGEKELETLQFLHTHLEKGIALHDLDLGQMEKKIIKPFAFLSQKPLIHVINVDEGNTQSIKSPPRLKSSCQWDTEVFGFCGSIESEIMGLEESERKMFLSEYNISDESSPRFLQAAYKMMNVITFYTIGDKEVKAWTLTKGKNAQKAAGMIHSDIEKGFIKAEVTFVEDILKFKSIQKCKENALSRLEGKDYIVQDGDVIYFRFNK